MRDAVALPVTVKHRIGLDANEDYGFVRDFVGTVAEAGCDVFIVHARNAVLKGLSPKENREVPRLRYEVVHRLKRDFPALTIVLNGGLDRVAGDRARARARRRRDARPRRVPRPDVPGTRRLAPLRRRSPPPTRDGVLRAMILTSSAQRARGVPLRSIARHMLGLYHGRPGGRRFRQLLSDAARSRTRARSCCSQALAAVEPALDEA